MVLGFGEKTVLAPALLLFECLLYDLCPGDLQVREATAVPEGVDSSVFSLAAAKALLSRLRSEEDLKSASTDISDSDFETVIDDVKDVIQSASGLTPESLSDLMTASERFMAQKYLEVAFGPMTVSHSKSSSLKTSVCSRSQSFVLEAGQLATSTDVTSHRLSSWENSSEVASRMEEVQRFTPPVLAGADSLEEDVSDPQDELKVVTSPQSASTGPFFSWTFLPPTNRVMDGEQQDGRWTSEESDSRNELMFIEYSHQSPRNAVARLTMSEISEDEGEEGRTQLDPRFIEGLTLDEYGVGFLSTTPKFRVLPAFLDLEESKKQRPPSFSSCDFATVALESPQSIVTPPKLTSPENSSEVEVENTMGKVFLEPFRNHIPTSYVDNARPPTVDFRDTVACGGRQTCGAGCTLL